MLEARTAVPTLGVVPWMRDLALPEEDALAGRADLGGRGRRGHRRCGASTPRQLRRFRSAPSPARRPAALRARGRSVRHARPGDPSGLQDDDRRSALAPRRRDSRTGSAPIAQPAGPCSGCAADTRCSAAQSAIPPASSRGQRGGGPRSYCLMSPTSGRSSGRARCGARCRLRRALRDSCGLETSGYELHMGESRAPRDAVRARRGQRRAVRRRGLRRRRTGLWHLCPRHAPFASGSGSVYSRPWRGRRRDAAARRVPNRRWRARSTGGLPTSPRMWTWRGWPGGWVAVTTLGAKLVTGGARAGKSRYATLAHGRRRPSLTSRPRKRSTTRCATGSCAIGQSGRRRGQRSRPRSTWPGPCARRLAIMR